MLISNQTGKKITQWRATAALSREREREGDYREHGERKGERERKGAVKRGEQGSCQMQMTSLGGGEGWRCDGGWKGWGAVAWWWRRRWWWGGLSSLFFPFREHPLLFAIVPLCDSWSWQCEGENKNRARCPARVGGRIGRHPSLPKANQAARVGGRRGLNPKQNMHRNWLNIFFLVFFKKDPPLFATEWHFSRHASCTPAS